MRTTADRILHSALTRFAGGEPLGEAVDFGLERELAARLAFAGRGARAFEWLLWCDEWKRAPGAAHRERVLGRCFTWAMATDAPASTRFTKRVAACVAHGVGRVEAVGVAIDRERDQQLVERWCVRARSLYSPSAVFPFILPSLQVANGWIHPHEHIVALARWVAARVQYVTDGRRWLRPDVWQPPALTLSLGTGDCEDSSLVLWSAMPLIGLESGRLVVGTVPQGGHAWVELPQIGVFVEATNGQVFPLAERSARGYVPYAYFTPQHCALATDVAVASA